MNFFYLNKILVCLFYVQTHFYPKMHQPMIKIASKEDIPSMERCMCSPKAIYSQ